MIALIFGVLNGICWQIEFEIESVIWENRFPFRYY